MEYSKSYFVEDPENSDVERFHLLGGADRDEDYYEGDDSDFEGDFEGDEGIPKKKKNPFECSNCANRKTSSTTKPCPPFFQKYFQPCSSKNTQFSDIYGVEYFGVNLFGVYFWGLILTFVNEGLYVGISQCFKGKTENFNFAKKDPRWEFTDLHYESSLSFYFIVWGIILFLYLIVCLIRFQLLSDSTRKNSFLGFMFPTTLLILTFVPAALSGSAWEAELQLPQSNDPQELYEYNGWIVLVIVPLLWPIVCTCFIVLFALGGSIFSWVRSKAKPSYNSNLEEEEEYEEDEGSDYQE